MLKVLHARYKQGYRTMRFPAGKPPMLPENFLGFPVISNTVTQLDSVFYTEICPASAIVFNKQEEQLNLDLGKCIFCGKCSSVSSESAISFSKEFSLAVSRREDLILKPGTEKKKVIPLEKARLNLFNRSFKLREVSAGGCNACEADTNVLTTIAWDLQRFGIDFVASPRHADGILVTGPVTKNMLYALENTYASVPEPKVVIAVGSCAISGGLYAEKQETMSGINNLFKVDLFIPGCPPHPLTILDGLLQLLNRK